ncbi:E3 ubiquitin ligase Rnf121-like isoform X2 [Ornithodoros turicata]|uniref:E3 ubiquitin ligase Rnf121-like isoform X2 n=1 Tax=Ornithodoros turicata TaxID=34597 RepID=UPI0031393B04
MAHHHHGIDLALVLNDSIDLSKFPDDERFKIEHARMHEKHRGHERMHAYMILILLVSVVVAQVVLVQWKKRHFSSYQRVSMVGMWIVPLAMSCYSHWWRFVFIWSVFTVLTCIVVSWALRKPIARTTPRWVYKWFYVVHMKSYALGVVGYIIVMMTLLGVNLIFQAKPQTWMDIGLLMLFYGLYFGLLGRDISEIITDRMACTIGIPRVLHSRLVHRGKEADLSLLQGKGGPQTYFLPSMAKATHAVRQLPGFHSLPSALAAHDHLVCTVCQPLVGT